jgi:hypothetical protein
MPAMTIDRSWLRIEEWLRESAPAAYAALPPAAGADVVRAAERACGVAFPGDVVASLRRHDGSGDGLLPGNYRLLSADEIAEEYVQWIRLDQRSVPEELRYWHSSWLPLATDGCGDSLFVETARGEGFGRIGRHSHGDGGRFDNQLQYASLDALLSWAAQALADGSTTDLLDYVITVGEDGFPYWEDADAQGDEVPVVWDMKELKNRYGPP